MPKLGRPSPAMLVALIALFCSLGGGAYAALKLPAKAVKSKNIAPNAVKSKHIAGDAVQGVDANESSFGKVPSAAKADDAGSIDGIDSAALPQVITGRADSGNGQADQVLAVGSMGVGVFDGTGFVDNSSFTVRNLRAAGGGNIAVDFATNQDANGSENVAPGGSSSLIAGKNGTTHGSPAMITDAAAPGRVLMVWCELGFSSKITCFALLSG